MNEQMKEEWEDIGGRMDVLPTVSLHNEKGEPGSYLVGEYVSTKQIKYDYDGEERKAELHTFKTEETNAPIMKDSEGSMVEVPFQKGMMIELWGFGQLNYIIKSVKPGDRVRLFYEGKAKIEGYKKPIHQIRLQRPKKVF